LQYSHEDSPIAEYQATYDAENNRVIYRSENLDYSKIFSVMVGLPIKITDWWRTQNNLIYTYQDLRAFNSNKEPYNLSMGNFMANNLSLFKLSNSLSAEISSKYVGSKYDGTQKREKYYIIDLGIQKKFSNNWGSLKFGIDDIFDSNKWVTITDIPENNLQIMDDFKFTQRTFKLTYSRSFGNRKLKSSRKRNKDFEEERRRVN
jgi:outer membrane receptor for ferrienterochelin and colicin